MTGLLTAVGRGVGHTFGKPTEDGIRLLAGLGVEGDAHMGRTVKHRSRVRQDPSQPNLRQVHLIHAQLHDELRASGFDVGAGQMGENVTTRGVDLLALPTGTTLRLGREASVRVTGLRNPCKQLDGLQPGLMRAVLSRDEGGQPGPQGRRHGRCAHGWRGAARGRGARRAPAGAPRTARNGVTGPVTGSVTGRSRGADRSRQGATFVA